MKGVAVKLSEPVPQVPAAAVPDDAVLVDVREPDEWMAGHAPGAQHIPLGYVGARYEEIPRDREVYVISIYGHDCCGSKVNEEVRGELERCQEKSK